MVTHLRLPTRLRLNKSLGCWHLTVEEAQPSQALCWAGQPQTVAFTINSLQSSKVDYSFALAKFTPGLPYGNTECVLTQL
jgi:hypothetical protein